MEKNQFSDSEKAILAIVQKQLPDSLTPYADIAKEVGVSEEKVLNLLQSLVQDGTVRRFGSSIKHQKTIWKHNAMVAWHCDPKIIDEIGAIASLSPYISHCYHRPSPDGVSDWTYTLFTMIHGKEPEDCQKVIDELIASTPLREYAILESLQEFKKSSMLYF